MHSIAYHKDPENSLMGWGGGGNENNYYRFYYNCHVINKGHLIIVLSLRNIEDISMIM